MATVTKPVTVIGVCVACGERFPQTVGRGRRRRYCRQCLPPVALAGHAGVSRRWRALNPHKVEEYNLKRRKHGKKLTLAELLAKIQD